MDTFKETERHFHDELSGSVGTRTIENRNSSFHRHFERPMMDLPTGSNVLEIACGTRVDGIEIAQSGKRVTSIDLSPDALVHAQALAQQSEISSSMRFAAADAEHLPFENAAFDASFVAASFHHFPHQLDALKEMRRVTKLGGFVIWGVEPAAWPYRTVFRALSPVKRLIRRFRKRQYDSIADDSTKGYTEQTIRALFSDAGLRIITIKRVKFLSELYDSGTRLFSRSIRKQTYPVRSIDHILAHVDEVLGMIPLLNKLYWHYNVISVVP